ncbi:MAG TPA: Fur family transcriptional regulator [Nocardioides sp.]|nr:Fur family transcriptional regulator [Nocardioides sp.]
MSDLGERLRARGKRLTSQRERVLAAVGRLGHATPDEVVDAVAAEGGDAVSASTVYRSLEALQELGLVGHTHVDHRAPSYHLAEHATHLHVVCRGCGWVGEAPLSAADEFVTRLDESLGFASDVSHAAVHGLCRTCREPVPAEDTGQGPALQDAMAPHPAAPTDGAAPGAPTTSLGPKAT